MHSLSVSRARLAVANLHYTSTTAMTGTQVEASARTVSNLAAQVRSGDDSWLQSVGKEDLELLKKTTDEDGRTLLHTIAAVGRLDLLQHVEAHGFMIAVNKADAEGWTPLLSGMHRFTAAPSGACYRVSSLLRYYCYMCWETVS